MAEKERKKALVQRGDIYLIWKTKTAQICFGILRF